MTGIEGDIRVSGGTDDETAAAVAAVVTYLGRETSSADGPRASRWTRQGRLEAQGIVPTPRALHRGWSVE